METPRTHKDKTQQKESSPKSKHLDKPCQRSQSRHKKQKLWMKHQNQATNNSILGKMELEESSSNSYK